MLRILLAVNTIAAIGVLVMEPRWELWPAAWFDALAYVEPYLLSEILLFYALSPLLARAPYVTGAGTVVGLTLLVGVAIDMLFGRLAPLPTVGLLRHVVLAMLLCCVLLGYFHLRAKALSPAITEARLQALQARIRPHFLFNSINAVLSLMRPDPKRAEEALEDLADLFRVLMRDNRDLGPLANEVELCRQYLHLEQLRLGDRLQIEWHLNSMPGDALVP
ncbi:MAG: histidine kinase, partial [Betaproteobacteria bacterium]